MSVVFPAPLGPMIAVTDPLVTAPETSARTILPVFRTARPTLSKATSTRWSTCRRLGRLGVLA